MRWSPIVVLAAVAAAVLLRLHHEPVHLVIHSTQTDSASDAQLAHEDPMFSCEGKTRCTEMSSCDEATFYVQNCPGVKIDGDEDGVPCESQHCQ